MNSVKKLRIKELPDLKAQIQGKVPELTTI